MRRNIKIAGLFGLIFFLSGCYYDSEEDLFPEIQAFSDCDLENVTFSLTVKPILQDNCYGCHSNANAPINGANIRLEDYSDVESIFDNVLGAVNHDPGFPPMPENGGKLSKCNLDKLSKWNEDGKLNN